MKKIFMSLALVAFLGMLANAQQTSSGVYLTLSDFENNKLTYASNAVSERVKIQFNEFLKKPYITVKHNGQKEWLFKDEIFAYKNNGNIVRTWNHTFYNFVEKGVIWIYYKDLSVFKGKGIKEERKYFYATSGTGDIIPLTIGNLKKSFPGKHFFHDFLNAQFSSDSDLSLYDKHEKKFRINHLLEATILNSGFVKNGGIVL